MDMEWEWNAMDLAGLLGAIAIGKRARFLTASGVGMEGASLYVYTISDRDTIV